MTEPGATPAVKRPFWWPLAWLGLQLQLLGLGLNSLAWNGVALLLYPLLPRALGRRVGRAMIAYGYRMFWTMAGYSRMIRLDADVLDALRDEEGLIVVANHPSMLDAVMIVARLPRAACIMKASLAYNPFLGPGARLARYIRNDPPRGMIRSAVRNLQAGGQLVLFPEGTRTVTPPINPFRPGMTLMAHMAQVPIQTVVIETPSPYLGKDWPIWRAPQFPVVFSARLGQRFAPEADHQGLLKRLENYFASELSR